MKSLTQWESDWYNTFRYHECTPTEMQQKEWIEQKKHYQINNLKHGYSLTVLNLQLFSIELHVAAQQKWLNFPTFLAKGIDGLQLLREHTHPSDRIFSLETELMGYELLMSLSVKERMKFRLKYIRRLSNLAGKYACFMFHISVLKLDEKGVPWLIQIETERMPGTYCPENGKYRDFSHKIPGNDHKINSVRLSDREIQILKLVNEGFKSSEIAAILGIKYDTVKNQRKSCIRKLKVKNTFIDYSIETKMKLL